MFDWLQLFLALGHASLLVGAIVYACKKLSVPWRDWPFVVYVLFWADLVLAGHVSSVFRVLDETVYYFLATIVSMAALLALFAKISRSNPSAPLLERPKILFSSIEDERTERFLKWFLIITLSLAALAELVLAFSVYPDNADSMIYRLPRAFWYVSNESFMHPFAAEDKRIVFYPLNGVSLYIPLVLYNLPGNAHNFPSYLTWAMLVYAAYRFARELGADRLLSLFSAWIVALTPSVLAQSTSTNDEILAAVSLLCGVYMLWMWMVSGKREYFLFAAISVGISVGTKLHIVFLSPIIFAMLVVALQRVRKNFQLPKRWVESIGWNAAAASLVMLSLMAFPFVIYNYLSAGRFYFVDDFAKDVFNLSGSFRGFFQNLLIYVSQMVVSPIADLNFWPVAAERQSFNDALNALFNPLIEPLLKKDASFYHLGYRFVGVTLPVSVRFVEFSLWSGFVWMLWPFQAALALRQKFSLNKILFLIALIPSVWLVFWSFSTLYMEGTATYFSYYLICAVPVAALVFAKIKDRLWSEIRWVVVVFVAITNLIICHNLLMFSGFRALPDIYYARTWPFDWDLFEEDIVKEIRLAKRARILLTHEKMPYFAYMHWNPRARYYSPHGINGIENPKEVLQILPISSLHDYGFMPIKIKGKKSLGLTYLGINRAIGREAVFAVGNEVHVRHPAESDYVVARVALNLSKEKGYTLSIDPDFVGLNAEDNLEFLFEMKTPDGKVFDSGWQKKPSFSVNTRINPRENDFYITTYVRSVDDGREVAKTTYKAYGRGAWLPDGGEY